MTDGCPFCNSPNWQLLRDEQGEVFWCLDCHHTWVGGDASPTSPEGEKPDSFEDKSSEKAD